MNVLNNPNGSASQTAQQGIQNGFKALAENSHQIANLNSLQTEATNDMPSLETHLVNNQLIATQVQSLAKALQIEDRLIGFLFEEWA